MGVWKFQDLEEPLLRVGDYSHIESSAHQIVATQARSGFIVEIVSSAAGQREFCRNAARLHGEGLREASTSP